MIGLVQSISIVREINFMLTNTRTRAAAAPAPVTSALFSALIFVFPSPGFCTSPRLSGDRLDSVLVVVLALALFVFSLFDNL